MKLFIAWLNAKHCPYADLRFLIQHKDILETILADPKHGGYTDVLTKKTNQAIRNYMPDSFKERLEKQLVENETRILLWKDPDYPEGFYEVDDPPPILYLRGKGAFPPQRAMAIVGSRHVTRYGARATERFSSELSVEKITIVSGFAEGIDSIAHRSALQVGETIAVLGGGIDWIYPKSNEGLYYDIAARGTLVTEFPFGEKPFGHHFPFRNRLISGLSEAILFMEGTHKSGALSTIRHGLNQGKEIYALPGDIDRKNSEGPNQLIFDGAEPLLGLEQILAKSGRERTAGETIQSNSLSSLEKLIYNLIAKEPCSVQHLHNLSNQSIHDIVSVLTSLELKSLIHRQGNQFYRTGR